MTDLYKCYGLRPKIYPLPRFPRRKQLSVGAQKAPTRQATFRWSTCIRNAEGGVPPVNRLTSALRKAFSKAAAPHESASMSSSTMAPRAGANAFHRGTTATAERRAWDLRRPAAWAARLGSLQSRLGRGMAATQMQVTAKPAPRRRAADWAQCRVSTGDDLQWVGRPLQARALQIVAASIHLFR